MHVCVLTLYIILVFLFIMRDLRKPTSPPLPLREGPPLISVFSPQGRRGNRPTRCSNRFAIRLADHQRSTPAAELQFFFVRDKPQGHTMLIARNLLGLLLMGTQGYNKYLLLWGRIAGGAADGNAGTRCRRIMEPPC